MTKEEIEAKLEFSDYVKYTLELEWKVKELEEENRKLKEENKKLQNDLETVVSAYFDR